MSTGTDSLDRPDMSGRPGEAGHAGQSDTPEPPELSIPDVARRLEVNERTVRRYIERGKLPAHFITTDHHTIEKRVYATDLADFIGMREAIIHEEPRQADKTDTLPALSGQVAATLITELRGTREAIERMAAAFEQTATENAALRTRIDALEVQAGQAGQVGHPPRPRSLVGQIAAYIAERLG